MTTITMTGRWAMRLDPQTEVRVLCVDVSSDRPVIYVTPKGNPITVDLSGRYYSFGESVHDLIPYIEPRKKVSGWVNVYQSWLSNPHKTRESADFKADKTRIACVYVTETDPPEDA